MFNPANQTHFSLQIDGLDHDLQVLEFSGREALDQPYRFEVELVSEKPDLDLAELLGKPAFLAFAPDAAASTAWSTQRGVRNKSYSAGSKTRRSKTGRPTPATLRTPRTASLGFSHAPKETPLSVSRPAQTCRCAIFDFSLARRSSRAAFRCRISSCNCCFFSWRVGR
mgnify:CR=1 FL=1